MNYRDDTCSILSFFMNTVCNAIEDQGKVHSKEICLPSVRNAERVSVMYNSACTPFVLLSSTKKFFRIGE